MQRRFTMSSSLLGSLGNLTGRSGDSITDKIAEASGDAVAEMLKTVLGNMS